MPEAVEGAAIVLSTLADSATARELARRLVEERLIACGTVMPGLESTYRWNGEIESTAEVLLVMKTREGLVPRLLERAAELHPYEVPELLALRASEVADSYGRWLRHETLEVNG